MDHGYITKQFSQRKDKSRIQRVRKEANKQ